jgi:hypothetical protein
MDGQGKVVDRPRAGQNLQINLRFSGDDPTRKSVRVSVAFATTRGVTLFICDSASAHKDSIKLSCNDIVRVKIPELPLSAGTYRLRLYLERSGIIEDWIKDDIEVQVGEGNFFDSGQNTPRSWEGQVVLVRNYWDVAAAN